MNAAGLFNDSPQEEFGERTSILRRKLNKFYIEGRFCDVIIKVQKRNYPCHRIVLASFSEYFDGLFRSNVENSPIQRTSLLDINTEVFEEILKFCYTEEEPITNDNVFNLLCASDFLGMQSLVERCVDYICQHKSSIKNIFEIFSFAHATNRESLMKIVCEYIIKKFNKLSQREGFQTMSVEALKILLKKYESPTEVESELRLSQMFRDENVLLDALIRWVKYCPSERAVHSEEIMRAVDFRKISPYYEEFLIQKFKIDRIVDGVSLKKDLCEYLLSNDSNTGSDDFVHSSPIVSENVSKLGLYAYMDTISDRVESTTLGKLNIFSTNKCKSKWKFLCHKDQNPYKDAHTKIITFGESPHYLYSLRCARSDAYAPTFFASSSIMLDLKHRLASPPKFHSGSSFNLCGTPNSPSMYLYYLNGSTVNHYNCQIDKWFPMIELSEIRGESCMVADSNLLYFIGGSTNSDTSRGSFVRAYDHRVPKWLKLSNTNKSYKCAAGTSLNGKIYVSDTYSIEVLDPVAGKWETLSSSRPDVKFEEPSLEKRMVAYENQLWIVSFDFYDIHNQSGKNFYDLCYYVQVFDPRDKTRQGSKSLGDISLNFINWDEKYDSVRGHYRIFRSYLRQPSFIQDLVVF